MTKPAVLFFTACWLIASQGVKTAHAAPRGLVSRFAQAGDARIHYVRAGSGSPVVLIHGFPRTWQSWEKIIPDLARTHTVVAPDVPGMGQSSRPARGYDPNNLASGIHALMRSLGFERYAVVAHDLGGPVGYALAATRPEAVTRLVMIETGVPGLGLEKAFDPAEGGTWHFGFFMAPTFPELLVKGKERAFMTAWMLRDEGPNAKRLPAEVKPFFDAYTRPGALHNAFDWYRGLKAGRAQNTVAGRQKQTMPVMAIGADRSFKGFTEQNLRNAATDVRGVIIADCGHFVAEDQPRALLNALNPFLN